MELPSLRSSYGLLLICAFWSLNTATTTSPSASTAAPDVSASASTAAPLPRPGDVVVENQTETSVTIRFDPVEGISEYRVDYSTDGEKNCSGTESPLRCIVDELEPARQYDMTLFSVRGTAESQGRQFVANTAPSKAVDFRKVAENDTSVTLEWKNDDETIRFILWMNGTDQTPDSDLGNPARHTVTGLRDATVYQFTLFTVFADITGAGVDVTAATAPSEAVDFRKAAENETSVTLEWRNDNEAISFILRINGIDQTLESKDLGNPARHTVTGLQDATLHQFTLFTFFYNISGAGVNVTAATAPRNVGRFEHSDPTETSILLRWELVPGITMYSLQSDQGNKTINDTNEERVENLQSGFSYNFTLFAVFEGVKSTGRSVTAATVPPQMAAVSVVNRTDSTLTFQWEGLGNGWSYILEVTKDPVTLPPSEGTVTHTMTSLTPGTLYVYNVSTIFMSLQSKRLQGNTVTAIDCTKVTWVVTETSIQGEVIGAFTRATASNGTQLQNNSGSNSDVKFTGLYPGAKYHITLMYGDLNQCRQNITQVTDPPSLVPKCQNCNSGYSICVEWDRPSGIWDFVKIVVSGRTYNSSFDETRVEIRHVQPAKNYKASISSESFGKTSKVQHFECATDARGVIAGASFGVLLFLVLLCAVVFLVRRRPGVISRYRKSPKDSARPSLRQSRKVPAEMFPAHFKKLSADEDKGFSLEYEDLAPVGTQQSQNTATISENKPKNRFVNVLPYDWSRVKLTSSAPHGDYINASYMPGYNGDREFIAAQGPMPSTVSDFWRMIWEQGVRGVVMVTNCTEGGRMKCERYWPEGDNPQICGDFTIFTTSEHKQPDWTLREFKVKHRRTSEERTVKHFHFTAWPDHGVPEGTEVLIQFRALVRRHIQTEAGGVPTVVHCSAGVGRTGTIIALDMLLQQLQKEKAVDINGFVHKMRLHRPHMVQTESQYVFLHQCVLDTLRQSEKGDENIYENELIYANATALRDYQNDGN